MLESDSFHHIITLNPEILLQANRDATYADVLRKGSMVLPDGIGLVWMGRLLGIPFRERIAGVDFMVELVRLAEQKEKTVFLLGGRNGAAQKTAEKLKQRFPKLMIDWSENADSVPNADIVFIALGAPKQELWIDANKSRLPGIKIAMGVGGAFNMIAGIHPRASHFMRSIGLEWLWRLTLEPRRIGRIGNAVIIFPFTLLSRSVWKR
ncbi:hypothetical protein A2988_04410 [Candidatus Azambacteria bacterium RIFCSPLOWO2_01_FULL_46_25]|uniref:Glycosyltransferase n=1 Tax=Candidatus Azambacteria bacterium RIFCSPLOWO2_01_FULL_46_25 TaxID=1797298 RepID=A0A1F5BVT7_9BACT|nr:MAG: hypothetical protein A2988_04410 [Candidatus Azambacteria bacterium RIFCSPLOWO2_01_FULL_46_25]